MYIFLTTKKGVVKKTELSEYANIRRNGLLAIKLIPKDELVWSRLTSGEDEIVLTTKMGQAIRFSEKDVRPLGRDTMGVRGVLLKKAGDEVVGVDVISKNGKGKKATTTEPLLLVVTEKGLGKKTAFPEFPLQKRGGMGVRCCEITERTGPVIRSEIIPNSCSRLLLTSVKGQIVKVPMEEVPKLGRATQGVILMRFNKEGDSLAAVACLD
ncbi:MAG: DNA gyrase C-terminal beta-propeller domain-containing protein [bacterium]|nr:DNA gyrase C-terminal beta-propeller domain-containing protein [bacterium]